MIIELFGLPGSGKTYVARRFADRRIIVKGRFRLVLYGLLFALRFPVRSIALFFYTVRYAGSWPLFYYKLINGFLGNNARYMLARKEPKSILDQGYLQNLLSAFESDVPDEVLRSYLKWLPKPDVLVIMDVPDEVRRQRQVERGRTARERFGASGWQASAERRFSRAIGIISDAVADVRVFNASDSAIAALEGLLNA